MIDEGGIDERFAAVNLTPCAMADSERTLPERLAQARAEAEDERIKAPTAEPWSAVLRTFPTFTRGEEPIMMIERPTLDGNALFATRLAYDLLGCCDNQDQVVEKIAAFERLLGEPRHGPHAHLVFASALKLLAAHVIPDLVKVIDVIQDASGLPRSAYDARVSFAESARNAWSARVSDLAGDEATG